MGAIKQKGTSGNARNFVTRTQAVRALQLSLADFRRLCIFKGIYPRVPRNKKKANKGKSVATTFYYAKDIKYLMHEPLIRKFRQNKTFAKKLTRALGKGEIGDAKRLEEGKPQYRLDHIIKERYPSFVDALRDLDDALNMLFLFSNMRSERGVQSKVIEQATKLTNQWMAYVAREGLLTKVFVTIKGVYYSANVKGQEIIWVVPFKFPQNMPTDVDFRVMLTFLQFYATLLHFVLYRLYTESGLVYPPRLDEARSKGIGGLGEYILEGRDEKIEEEEENNEKGAELSDLVLARASKADAKGAKDDDDKAEPVSTKKAEEATTLDKFVDNNKNKGDQLIQPSDEKNPISKLFSKFVFYIGREVPIDIIEFVILASGGKVISEASLDELAIGGKSIKDIVDLSKVTHQICDRPKVAKKVAGRTYIQPQWIFDSINKGQLQNVSEYAPGETLPPHLSPWGDKGTYNPEEEIENNEDEEDEGEEEGNEEEEPDESTKKQKELELEASGVKYSEIPKEESKKSKKIRGKKRKAADEKEEKELKMMMMSKKQRSLYKRMKHGIDENLERTKQLEKKKRQLASKKQKLAKH